MIMTEGRKELEDNLDNYQAIERYKELCGMPAATDWILATFCMMEYTINELERCGNQQENKIRKLQRENKSLIQTHRNMVRDIETISAMRQRLEVLEQVIVRNYHDPS